MKRPVRTCDPLCSDEHKSLLDLGFVHAGIDDGWQACGSFTVEPSGAPAFHDAAGKPIVNATKFPDLKALRSLPPPTAAAHCRRRRSPLRAHCLRLRPLVDRTTIHTLPKLPPAQQRWTTADASGARTLQAVLNRYTVPAHTRSARREERCTRDSAAACASTTLWR